MQTFPEQNKNEKFKMLLESLTELKKQKYIVNFEINQFEKEEISAAILINIENSIDGTGIIYIQDVQLLLNKTSLTMKLYLEYIPINKEIIECGHFPTVWIFENNTNVIIEISKKLKQYIEDVQTNKNHILVLTIYPHGAWSSYIKDSLLRMENTNDIGKQ